MARGRGRLDDARVGDDIEGVMVERVTSYVLSVDQNPSDTGRRLRQSQYRSHRSASTRLKAHTGILTILRRDSSPVSLPVWYVVDEHTIVMRTPPTKKVGHIKRDARAAFLVEPGER